MVQDHIETFAAPASGLRHLKSWQNRIPLGCKFSVRTNRALISIIKHFDYKFRQHIAWILLTRFRPLKATQAEFLCDTRYLVTQFVSKRKQQ